MTLTNRVSAFFLGWLALSLIGFAAAIYFVTRANLYRQVDQQLSSTLNTLAAGAEINDEGVEWEPHERTLPRPSEHHGGVAWTIVNPQGESIDRAGNHDTTAWLSLEAKKQEATSLYSGNQNAGRAFRVQHKRLNGPANMRLEESSANESILKYEYLDILAAVPLGPVHSELRKLAVWLIGLSTGLWLVAALVGRWLCRRTLAPVAVMAAEAASLGRSVSGERLSIHATHDELEQLGLAFNGALDRMEDAFERQRRFTGDAAHQLRTPLAAMLGQVEVALRRDREGPEYRTTLQTVEEKARHLQGLTESLLFLARADADALIPNLQEIEIADWLASFVESWRTECSAIALSIPREGQKGQRIRAHPELLGQLMGNLLDNAIKYGRPGSPIDVRLISTVEEVTIVVEDHGPGIEPAALPHIFEPFFRSNAARSAGTHGSGLGLAVAKRISSAMSARLTVESELGGGSLFSVCFPHSADSAKNAESAISLNSTRMVADENR